MSVEEVRHDVTLSGGPVTFWVSNSHGLRVRARVGEWISAPDGSIRGWAVFKGPHNVTVIRAADTVMETPWATAEADFHEWHLRLQGEQLVDRKVHELGIGPPPRSLSFAWIRVEASSYDNLQLGDIFIQGLRGMVVWKVWTLVPEGNWVCIAMHTQEPSQGKADFAEWQRRLGLKGFDPS